MNTRDALRTTSTSTGTRQELLTHAEIEERIRNRAYELYLERGRQDGFAEQDWLQAESEILSTNAALKAVA